MATVKVSNRITAPVEQVFQIFTDIEHGVEHVSGITKIEPLTTGRFSLESAKPMYVPIAARVTQAPDNG